MNKNTEIWNKFVNETFTRAEPHQKIVMLKRLITITWQMYPERFSSKDVVIRELKKKAVV